MNETRPAWTGPWRPLRNLAGEITGFTRHYALDPSGQSLQMAWVEVPSGLADAQDRPRPATSTPWRPPKGEK